MELRTRKQIIIGAIYGLIFLIFVGLLYFFFFYHAPVCTDGVQNGKEEGVDCGGVCANACKEVVKGESFTIEEVAIVPGGTDRYDVLGRIYNPNDTEGASSFEYTLTLTDSAGKILVSKKGTSYVLPQERKTLIEVGLVSTEVPSKATLTIGNIAWERFSGYQERPNINIYQKRYNQVAGGVGFGEAFGLVSNESPFDFRSLTVKVILRDGTGKALAVNTTEMRTITTGEERDFRLLWPEAFPGTVEQVDMEVDADYYHADNFLKQYLPGGRFQEVTPSSSR